MAITLKDLIKAQEVSDAVIKRETVSAEEFRKMVSDSTAETKAQTKALSEISKTAKQDKLIQLTQAALQLKTDRDLNKDQDESNKHLATINSTLEKGLINVGNKTLNANILELINEVKKQGKTKSSIKEKMTAEMAQTITEKGMSIDNFKTPREILTGGKKKEAEFLTLKGFMTQSGLMNENSTGFIANAVNKRQARKDFINDRMKVDGNLLRNQAQYKKLSPVEREKAIRANLGKQFDRGQEIRGSIRENEAEIADLKKRGYTEEQIKRSGLLKKREELAGSLHEADPRVRMKAEKEEVKETRKQKSQKAEEKGAEVTQRPSSSEDFLEAQRSRDAQVDLLKKIEENTRGANRSNTKEAKKEQTAQKEESNNMLDGIGDMIGSFGKKALGTAGRTALGAGKALLSYAAPAAIMLGAGMAVDSAAGALGVGGKQIDEKQDDANWQKMSTFQKIESGAARGIEKVGGFIGLGNLANEAKAKRIENETAYLNSGRPSIGNAIYDKSANNSEAIMNSSNKASSSPVIVSAPTTNNVSKQTVAMPPPVRNADAGFNRYLQRNASIV